MSDNKIADFRVGVNIGRVVFMRGLVDDIRTGFERRNDATVYIPTFYPTRETTIV